MSRSAIIPPEIEPTPIFEFFRGNYATELLTAAVTEFQVFFRLREGSKSMEALSQEIGLAPRPATVLFTALRAMKLLSLNDSLKLELTPMAREHLVPGGAFFVGDYIGLAAESPGVRNMIERLKTNRPAGAKDPDKGVAFIFREGLESAMEREASARHLTLALSGRAKNVAPVLAENINLHDAKVLLDIGGGTGIYSIACLQKYPQLRAIVWDRPEVLKVAQEFAQEFGVQDRLECVPGDMFADPFPLGADVMLLSNILHDWDIPECETLIRRSAEALPVGGQLLIHDVFLNDALDGPLPIALYSAALFSMTEGRAYSAGEYRTWLKGVGFQVGEVKSTLIHCGVLSGNKV